MPLDASPAIDAMPTAFVAEMALLACVLERNEIYPQVSGMVRAEMFADSRHAAIWEHIAALIERGETANAVTLKDALDEKLADLGGGAYLAKLSANVVYIRGAPDYARVVRDRYLRRETIYALSEAIEDARTVSIEQWADDIIADTEKRMGELARDPTLMREAMHISAALEDALSEAEQAYKAKGAITGIRTGLADLDEHINGVRRGQLVILAGRPGMGKSTAAVNMARTMASAGLRIGYFTLEMSAADNACVLLASEAGISARDIQRGRLDQSSWARLADAKRRLSVLPIEMVRASGYSIAEIESEAVRLRADVIIIDHLGLAAGATREDHARSRYEKVAGISNALKTMANRLNIPVIALAQLNRETEKRDDKRPSKSDLRDAGDIEQDADVILFLYRHRYYSQFVPMADRDAEWHLAEEKERNVAEIIVAKQRMGPEGVVRVFYDPVMSRFEDLSRQASMGLSA